MNPIESLSRRFDAFLWGQPTTGQPRWKSNLIWLARLLYALARDVAQGNLSLHAQSLVYTTLLSLVPFLAVTFSVLKGFGVHNELQPLLGRALAPLGDGGADVTSRVIGFVDNMQVGVLGSVGLAMLIVTVLSLIQKIERVFNDTWRVSGQRPLAQRFSQYLSVLLVGPVLFFSAVGLSASLSAYVASEPFFANPLVGFLLEILNALGPFLMISLTFAFVYKFVPNTRVHVQSALIGGFVAGFLWIVVGDLFASFMAGSTRYTAIYSSLAILLLLMIWMNIAWSILLIGASVAFYHQHPEHLATRSAQLSLSNRHRERLALLISAEIARRYDEGEPAPTCQALAKLTGSPNRNAERILTMLERSGFVLRTADDDPGYVLTRAAESIQIKDLLAATRAFGERDSGFLARAPGGMIGELEKTTEDAVAASLKGMTLKDVAGSPERGADPA